MEDNFDDMSNDQLRLKLLEFGLANMPVTSTTRKVLIKKLRNHISNGAGKNVRRETIHITKYSSDEDSEPLAAAAVPKKLAPKKVAANRRATIGGPTAKPSKPIPSSQPTAKVVVPAEPSSTSKRRSVKDAPASQPPLQATTAKVMTVLEDSDDDMIPLTQLTQRNRKSKSPSLSRAEMLTTSYMHHVEVKKAEPIMEEMEVDVPEATKNIDTMDVIVLDDDDFDESSMPPPSHPLPQPVAKESYYSKPTSQTETRRTTATNTMDQFVEPPPVKYGGSERSATKPTSLASAYRSSVSTPLRTETEPRYDSPYLSEFTRRLSQLRAESTQSHIIDRSRESPTRRTMFDGSSTSTRTVPRNAYEGPVSRYRQTIAPPLASERTYPEQKAVNIRSSMRQSLLALDRKYSVRKIIYSILIVLVVVFLFVFFFQ